MATNIRIIVRVSIRGDTYNYNFLSYIPHDSFSFLVLVEYI